MFLVVAIWSTSRGVVRAATDFPNARNLAQLANNGDILNRLQLKLIPIIPTSTTTTTTTTTTSSSNTTTTTGTGNATTTTQSPNEPNEDDDEDVLLQNQAQRILDEIADSCHSFRRLFRSAGKFEQDHRQAGLHYWFVYDCGGGDAVDAANGNGPQQLGEGLATVAALSKLDTLVNELGDPHEFGIEIAMAEYRVQETVVKESMKDVGVVNPPDGDAKSLSHYNLKEGRSKTRPRQRQRQRQQQEQQDSAIPNDPLLDYQDHYDAINLQEAWQIMTEQNAWPRCKDVVVHVLDSGWDMDHEDLGINRWTNPGEDCTGSSTTTTARNGNDDDNNGYVDDCYGYNFGDNNGRTLLGEDVHGSHCTGTIAANTDNDMGVTGIAGGRGIHRGVSIMTSVGFGAVGSGGFAEALVYAADNGAHISSNSWGYTSPGFYDAAVVAAIDYADARHVLVVFAAGNGASSSDFYPAYYSKAIAVAATDNDGVAASFTNFGRDWVDIAAPGVQIASTGLSRNQPNVNSDQYIYLSGTSMACPHVSGLLALGKCLYPSATAPQLKQCLYDTATDVNNPDLGNGLINPPGFLNCVLNLMDGEGYVPSPTRPPIVQAPTSTPIPQEPPPTTPLPTFPTQGSCSGNCYRARAYETGCDCASCQAAVCDADSFCCTTEWDGQCVEQATELCSCNTCDDDDDDDDNNNGNGDGCDQCGDCIAIRSSELGCSCPSCQTKVCQVDSYCCTLGWDLFCAITALSTCSECISPAISTSNTDPAMAALLASSAATTDTTTSIPTSSKRSLAPSASPPPS
ncbi:hypothetical protein ACA910_006627 [Epithemia clementina (nom. ined.)]